VEQREAGEALGDDAAEPVGVDVEERGVREQPQLGGEVPRDVAAVEVDPRDHRRVCVVQRLRARHAEVGAHVGAAPVASEVLRVGVDGAAQGLQRDVGAAEAVVGEGHVHADVELEVVWEVAVLSLLAEGEQLTTRDQGGIRVRQRRGGGRRREQEEQERGGEVVDEGAADAGGLHGGEEAVRMGGHPLRRCLYGGGGRDIGGEESRTRPCGGARVPEVNLPLRAGGCRFFFGGKAGGERHLVSLLLPVRGNMLLMNKDRNFLDALNYARGQGRYFTLLMLAPMH
jgi:hypothetical protein